MESSAFSQTNYTFVSFVFVSKHAVLIYLKFNLEVVALLIQITDIL